MDYTDWFSETGKKRKPNLISQMALAYFKNPSGIFFAGGMPNTRTFPYKEIDVSFGDGTGFELKDSDLDLALQYGPAKGFLPLVEVWRKFQIKWHTPKFYNWDVHFTTGSQDGCSKIFELFINPGDPIMIQTPTYTGTLKALFSIEPELIEIKQDKNGINPEDIKAVCEERILAKKLMPKLLYVNPVGANPTGTVLPNRRRQIIYELAKKYNFLIVEDDPCFFLHFLDEYPTSFLSLDVDGRVIRLDSFSKILSAGLRLGVVTAHKDILDKMSLHIQCTTLHAPSISQLVVYKTMVNWDNEKLEAHFKTIQVFYRSRLNLMLDGLAKHLTDLAEWTVPEGGLFVWLKITVLDDILNLIMNEGMKNGIFILPGHAFQLDFGKKCQHVRLCYSYATSEQMEKGLSILAKIIREEVASEKKIE